jgi:hypothetical protein
MNVHVQVFAERPVFARPKLWQRIAALFANPCPHGICGRADGEHDECEALWAIR